MKHPPAEIEAEHPLAADLYRADLLRRLHCVCGHLEAVAGMIEADRPCDQTLHQLHAVQAALAKVGQLLIKQEAQACLKELHESACLEETAERIQRLLQYTQPHL